ncbi:MAG: response regulator [Cyanobacteria bacterium REEB67]|nr:response regulator [Cyanobacteria bacterium REEB67]
MSEERILLLEDRATDAALMRSILNDAGYKNVDVATNEIEYLTALNSGNYAAIVSDHAVPGTSSAYAFELAHRRLPDVPMICVSGDLAPEEGASLLAEGVGEYVSKDQLWRLPHAVERAVKYKRLVVALEHQLEDSRNELRSLTHILSHDLKSPLYSIYQIAQMVVDQQDVDVAECRTVLTAISDDALRLTEMTGALQKFYTLALNDFFPTKIDLSALVGSLMAKQTSHSVFRQVQTIVQPDLYVVADLDLLTTLLENLLNNAWKFTSKTDDPRIEFGCRPATQPNAPDTFFVKDNGAGFDMKLVKKLFHPFQRLHASSEFDGTGIGLATVERIARRHHGRAWIEGEKGVGTTVFFTLAGEPLS